MADRLARAILRVGDGRGFVVACRSYGDHYDERVIITAAHCLPFHPQAHPARYLDEETYRRVLGPLGGKRTVWARCLFVDPMADIAVLGEPDSQELYAEADTYDDLVGDMTALTVADAPAMSFERVTYEGGLIVNGQQHSEVTTMDRPIPGRGRARVLSLKGRWLEGKVERRHGWLMFEPQKYFVGGMSGSPIINDAGAAIGVVSVDQMSPVIVDSLSAQLVHSILAAGRSEKA